MKLFLHVTVSSIFDRKSFATIIKQYRKQRSDADGGVAIFLWRGGKIRRDKFDVGGSGRAVRVPLQSASQFVGAAQVCGVFS